VDGDFKKRVGAGRASAVETRWPGVVIVVFGKRIFRFADVERRTFSIIFAETGMPEKFRFSLDGGGGYPENRRRENGTKIACVVTSIRP